MNKWLVVNIGCIECRVPSGIVGLFSNFDKATAIAENLADTHHWRHGGQNEFEVYPLPECDVVADEYTREAE